MNVEELCDWLSFYPGDLPVLGHTHPGLLFPLRDVNVALDEVVLHFHATALRSADLSLDTTGWLRVSELLSYLSVSRAAAPLIFSWHHVVYQGFSEASDVELLLEELFSVSAEEQFGTWQLHQMETRWLSPSQECFILMLHNHASLSPSHF